MDDGRALGHRLLRGVVGRQLAHLELDQRDRALGGGIVDGGDRRDRLAAVAHLVARHGMLAARDRQHAERLVAVGAGDDRLHARELQGGGHIDVDDLGVRIGAAEDAPRQHAGMMRSAVYFARPETFSGPSTIGT